MGNKEENCEKIWKIWKRPKLIVKRHGKHGRKESWIVIRFGKYGRNPRWIVKWYGKYVRKLWKDMKNMDETQVE